MKQVSPLRKTFQYFSLKPIDSHVCLVFKTPSSNSETQKHIRLPVMAFP